jgi:hypothetical protein
MRRVQEADTERAEKASQRNRQKEVQKQQLLEANFRVVRGSHGVGEL